MNGKSLAVSILWPLLNLVQTKVKPILGCTLIVLGLLLCVAGGRLYLRPEMYRATARIKLDLNELTNQPSADIPSFVQSQFDVIQSEVTLTKVVEILNLNQLWGNQHGNGTKLKTSESLAMLRARLDLRRVSNTTLIDICASSEKPNEAAEIVNTVAKTCKLWQLDQSHKQGGGELDRLKATLKEQEQKISTAREKVQRFEKQLSEVGASGLSQELTFNEPEEVRNLRSSYLNAKQELDDMMEVRALLGRKINVPGLIDIGPSVEIIEHAVPPLRPVSPNGPIRAALVLVSLLTGVVAVGFGAWLILCRSHRHPASS